MVNRKTCGGGNRTAKGAQAQSTLMCVLQSCRHKGIRVIDIVTSILRAPDNTPSPWSTQRRKQLPIFCKGIRTHHQQQTAQAPQSERKVRSRERLGGCYVLPSGSRSILTSRPPSTPCQLLACNVASGSSFGTGRHIANFRRALSHHCRTDNLLEGRVAVHVKTCLVDAHVTPTRAGRRANSLAPSYLTRRPSPPCPPRPVPWSR